MNNNTVGRFILMIFFEIETPKEIEEECYHQDILLIITQTKQLVATLIIR